MAYEGDFYGTKSPLRMKAIELTLYPHLDKLFSAYIFRILASITFWASNTITSATFLRGAFKISKAR